MRLSRVSFSPSFRTMSPLILSGVFDRFPDFKIFFAETRVGWIPFWLEMADYWYDKHLSWNKRLLGFTPPQRMPSEYIRDNIVLSVQHVERTAIEMRKHSSSSKPASVATLPAACSALSTVSSVESSV